MRVYFASVKRRGVKGRTTLWIPKVRLAGSDGYRDFSREVTSLLTGNGHFNRRLFSLRLSDTQSCMCREDENWEHLLRDCPLYDFN
jgi:hypothetical protein